MLKVWGAIVAALVVLGIGVAMTGAAEDCCRRNSTCKASQVCCQDGPVRLFKNASGSCKECTKPTDGPECAAGATTTSTLGTSPTTTTTLGETPCDASRYSCEGKLCGLKDGTTGNYKPCEPKAPYCRGTNFPTDHQTCQRTPAPWATTTTTTKPASTSTTTSTTRASTTTTTVPSPTLAGVPERWDDPSDPYFARYMSRSYPSLDNILWDPRGTSVVRPDGTAVLTGKTATYADQYTRQARVYQMHLILAAKIGRWVRDYGTVQQQSKFRGLQRDIKKFMLIYNFRDPGEKYGWTPNYIWGLWQSMLDLLAEVKGPALPTDLASLVRTDWPVAKRGKKVSAFDDQGIFDPKRKFEPLADAQAALLHGTHVPHEEHVACLLDHDAEIPIAQYRMHVAACGAQYGAAVRAAHAAFAASARDRWEANLFDTTFTGDIDVREGDPFATVARADALTRKTSIAHQGWMRSFNVDVRDAAGKRPPPDQSRVILFTWKHGETHFRRAIALSDMPTPEIVFDPVLEPAQAAAFPKCVAATYPKRQADGGNSTYDVRTCPKPAN